LGINRGGESLKVFLTVDNTNYMDEKIADRKTESEQMNIILDIYNKLLKEGVPVQLKFTNLPAKEH